MALIFFLTASASKSVKHTYSGGTLYLENYDTTHLEKDIRYLKQFSFVKAVTFISKEDAKKKWLEDGNQDWSKVLNENPLPEIFELLINTDGFDSAKAEEFKKQVMQKIKSCTEVQLPIIPIK